MVVLGWLGQKKGGNMIRRSTSYGPTRCYQLEVECDERIRQNRLKYTEIFGEGNIRNLLAMANFDLEELTGDITKDFSKLYKFLIDKNESYNILPDTVIGVELQNSIWLTWFLKQIMQKELSQD